MKKRKALLIGVSEYECDALEDLPVVQRDLEILHDVLEDSHYTVRLVGTEGVDGTGQNKILRALRRELLNAEDVDVLLLYFSGHGIHYEGKDYLIPSDADFEDPTFTQYLITPDALRDAIDSCSAKTILFVVDACRHGIKLGVKDISLSNWSRGEVRKAIHRSYILIFACGPGEVSQYISGESGASLFTHAFSQALNTETPARTLEEVLVVTQEKLNSLVKSHSKKTQRIRHLLYSRRLQLELSERAC